MGKNMSGVHPDRSEHMTDRPAISHKGSMPSSKSIRDTPEGRKVLESDSKCPYGSDKD